MNIYIANLVPEVDEEMLQELFSPYGEIEKVRIMVDLQTNISKGYAFITMPDEQSAINAIHQLNGSLLKNKKIAVREAGKSSQSTTEGVPVKTESKPKLDWSIFEDLPFKGVIKFFEQEKGFGFILLENQRELFFHYTELPEDMPQPPNGQPVVFNLQFGKKGFVAINIKADI